LVIVPDSTYESVAFAALWNASKSRFLVEERSLRVSSSVSAVSGRSTEPQAAATDVLVVEGPDSRAETELKSIAAAYRSSTVLSGESATGAGMFAQTPRSAIIHISARTLDNRAYPLLSRIELADEPGRPYSGTILARDVAARQLPQTRLIVIDGNTGDAGNDGEGAMGLTRAFLAAGVPAVVGTLPGTDEAATRQLMVDLHRLMSSGMPADEALNTLQRNVLQSNGRRLGAWCALVLYGSDR
jgi:CHAT domain-containing protein